MHRITNGLLVILIILVTAVAGYGVYRNSKASMELCSDLKGVSATRKRGREQSMGARDQLLESLGGSAANDGKGEGIPKASSAKVQATVLEIAQDYYRDLLAATSYQQISGIPIDIVGIDVDYDWLRDNADTDESAMKALKALAGVKAKMNLSLQNIRTEEVDKDIGKIRCRCDVACNGATDVSGSPGTCRGQATAAPAGRSPLIPHGAGAVAVPTRAGAQVLSVGPAQP